MNAFATVTTERLRGCSKPSLAGQAMTSLRGFFHASGHNPSAAHWAALADIAETLEAMALGSCSPKIKLSAVDPGVGKTQTVTHFTRAMVADPRFDAVGMVICVGRIAEAVSLATELGIPTARLAVLTSDSTANALGNAAPQDAQVLITTQQRIELRCRGGSFAETADFHFRGQPRAVRVWDEAWLPGTAISLNRDDLAGLFLPMRAGWPKLTDAIEDLFFRLRSVPDGGDVDVPDFTQEHGVGLHEALGIVDGCRDDQRAAVTSLYVLSGRIARVRRDGPTGNAMLTYRDTLPSDLAPMLVLDASGRVRQTYADIKAHRGTLELLATAAKDYSPLTVHVWHTAGSKSGWTRRGPELADGIVRTILTKPAAPWLIVHHKRSKRTGDVEALVRRALPASVVGPISFVPWGQHMATNAYADVGNVILAGSLFMRPSFYVALTHLAQGKPVDRHRMDEDDVTRTMAGEHRNLLLQAVCRGRVRKLNGGSCLPMDAYVIASPVSGIPASIKDIFPGCSVRQWEPLERKLTGRIKDAVEFVEAAFSAGAEQVPYAAIYKGIGMAGGHFTRLTKGNAEWLDAVSGLGLEVVRGKRGVMVLRLIPDAMIA